MAFRYVIYLLFFEGFELYKMDPILFWFSELVELIEEVCIALWSGFFWFDGVAKGLGASITSNRTPYDSFLNSFHPSNSYSCFA